MPTCPNCGNDIPQKAMEFHQIMCKGKKVQPVATIPTPSKVNTIINPVQTIPNEHDKLVSDVKTVLDHYTENPVDLKKLPEVTSVPEQHNGNGGTTEITYPTADPYFMVQQYIADAFKQTDKISESEPANVLITGHAGCGKTSVAMQFAAINHRPLVVADFGIVQEPQQLFQTTHLIADSTGKFNITETRESAFIRGIETPRCVVVMDELTRVENERCLNPLMPILDGRKTAWIDELRRHVTVAPGVVFIATINEGSAFCGVTSLDKALRDRFAEIYLDYIPADQLVEVVKKKCNVPDSIAISLAQFAWTVQTTPAIEMKVSTRQMLRAAKYWKAGAPLWQAVELSIGNFNDAEWRQQVLEIFSMNIKDLDEYKKWEDKKSGADKYVYMS